MLMSREASKLRLAFWPTFCDLESRCSVHTNQSPLLVNAVGTELNQVWTNIIENAIDAMLGQGELRVRTFCEDNMSWLKSAIAALEFPLR